MNDTSIPIPKSYWIIAIVALLWNLTGVGFFFQDVLMSEETIAGMTEPEQAIINSVPVWTYVIFGMAVFGGVLGSIGLLVKHDFAILMFLISLISVLIQTGYSFLMTDMLEVYGMNSLIRPVIVVLVAGFLYFYSLRCQGRGWISE